MRKLPPCLENPIDNLIYFIVSIISPWFHDVGFTPNMITSLSLLCGVYSAALIMKKCYLWAMALYFIAYVLDCLDGYNARKYKMVSKFGDYYDHLSDLLKIVLIMAAFYNVDSKLFIWILPIILLEFVFLSIHFGCQEVYYDQQDDSDTLSFIGIKLTSNKIVAAQLLCWTRIFGSGSFTLMLMIIMYIYKIYSVQI